MIKALIFDLTQTLINSADGFRAAEKAAQECIAEDINPDSHEAFLAIYREVRACFHAQSRTSRVELWKEVYRRHDQKPNMPCLEQWENEYWGRVEDLSRLFPETERVLDALGGKYQLGLVTNIQHPGRHLLDAFSEIKEHFDSCVLAGADGMPPKPAAEPFTKCLQQLGVSSDAAVYVGDDWRIDMQGGRNAGMRVVWLQQALLKKKTSQVETDIPIITTLEPLLNLKLLLENR